MALAAMLLAPGAPVLAAAGAPPLKIEGPEISMLIRTTIVALHQANLTANYSVLRDLGDGQFQAAYSQATLSDMFRAFREQRINLAPTVLYDAQLDAPPRLTTDGLLRVVGHFPTAPEQVIFDITFRNQGGVWWIDAINAGMSDAPIAVQAPVAQTPVPLAQPAPRPAAVKPLAEARPVAPASRPILRIAAPMPGIVDVSADTTGFQ